MWHILFFGILALHLCADEKTERVALLASLQPESIKQHLAFYQLYSESVEGRQALKRAWVLLSGAKEDPSFTSVVPPELASSSFITSIVQSNWTKPPVMSDEALALIQTLSAHLPNRGLKGNRARSKEEILSLTNEEVDIARALLIFQLQNEKDIERYEASIDLMALQILASGAKIPEEKIRAINHLIFDEMGFRFPPHSIYSKNIDLYTFLSNVIDSREGVCLGVSILYLSLAQRVGLPLEIVTPPGHIFVRYRDGEKIINIETTNRGVDLPSSVYLGVNTRSLDVRSLKEVVGLNFMNAAAVCIDKEEYEKALPLYQTAEKFLGKDKTLQFFLGLTYLFTGHKIEGNKILKTIAGSIKETEVSKETVAEDYGKGFVGVEGLKVVYAPVDETIGSVMAKQEKLHKVVKKYPKFRAGLFSLATTYLQLGRNAEGYTYLLRQYALDKEDVTLCYYLSQLAFELYDYKAAWKFLKEAEALEEKRGFRSEALKNVRRALRQHSLTS